ncbi:hypothetical protein V9T40_008545 [Parthenolecanium corni]|uniref:Uncharacterized protein n=1 Tax=Parthenolecanium corni TaxID=536013 RepID=A0AAN9TL29_9HEMI
MNDSSNSIASLMDENKDLRFEIEQQLNIIESQKQELHSANRKLETLNKMKVEMEIEIEALTGLHQIKGNLETKVKNLEAELSLTKLKCTNLETELQTEKTNYEVAINELNSEIISNLKKGPNDESREERQKEEFQMKLSLLQEANNVLTSNNFDLQTENKGLNDKIILHELTINEKNQEVEELKQLLEAKSNELKSALKLVEELQGEKAALNAELATLKCHPVTANNKRGNSLFAEVDDKRLTVSRELEAFKNKYKELKKSFLKKNAELKALEAENIELRKQWTSDQNAPYESMAALLESHKVRIQELNYIVSILEKRPENPQLINVSELTNRNFDCIKDLVDTERKLNHELRQEMEKRSIRELSQSEEIFKLSQERRVLKAQTMKDAATIAEFKLKIDHKV